MFMCYILLGLVLNHVWADTLNATTYIENDDDSYYPSKVWSDIFDWKVLQFMSKEAENILVSPTSLKIVLALLYEGSSGSTQKEFEANLQSFNQKASIRNESKSTLDSLHVQSKSANKLKISTRIFLDSVIKPKDKYAKNAKEFYGSDIVPTNFTDSILTSKKINQWVDEATFGTISKLTSPGDLEDMIMLIANTVYFKGVWRHQFPKNTTCVSEFYFKPDRICYVPFMTTTNVFYFLESDSLDARILRLPYQNSEFSMFIILPRARGGLSSLIQGINSYDLGRQLYSMSKRTVQVTIPRFQFKFKSSYNKIFQKFGLRKAFQNTASFPGIVEGHSSILRQLVVSDVIQSTGIEVDEEGTIAYAATDVTIGNKIGIPDEVFTASHPFLFFIQEETKGTIIFVGKFENPLNQDIEIKKEKDDDIEEDFVTTEYVFPTSPTET